MSPTVSRRRWISCSRKSSRLQVFSQTADSNKISEIGVAADRVRHFGMELQTEELAIQIADRRVFAIRSARENFETRGQRGYFVAVAHPDRAVLRSALRVAGRLAFE